MENIGIETEQIEFKKTTGELKEAVKSVVAILNKHGIGELYFGVRNNGDVLGQDVNDDTLRKVSQAFQNHISPPVFPQIDPEDWNEGKRIIHVKFRGDRQPYLAMNIPYIRQADEDLVMDQDTYASMLFDRGGDQYRWENRVSTYTVNDIDRDSFEIYLQKAKEAGRITFKNNDPRTVLEKLGLLSEDGTHLLNAGAALFCPCDTNDVQMAKFATDVRSTFTDIRRSDRGSIIKQAKICEQYIIDAMDWKADIVGLERIETPEIPVEAIREAVINSFGHRLYGNGQCNEIDVFKDRIEIHSTGGFPKGHTPEEFLDGKKRAVRRNKLLTGILYYSRDMETFATGLQRIKELCDKSGCKVEFRPEQDDFTVIFYRNLRETWGEKNLGTKQAPVQDTPAQKKPKRPARNTKKKTIGELTELQRNILDLLRENPKITQAQLSKQLNRARSTIQIALSELESTHILTRVGGTRGFWKINS